MHVLISTPPPPYLFTAQLHEGNFKAKACFDELLEFFQYSVTSAAVEHLLT